jgi:hypothetical protein
MLLIRRPDPVIPLTKRQQMQQHPKLILIKLFHTLIWLFFNVVIFYLVYAALSNTMNKWVWICIGLLVAEGIVLLVFKYMCPITLIARKYSDSRKANFDIFLPEWLARNNKIIYTTIVLIALALLCFNRLK